MANFNVDFQPATDKFMDFKFTEGWRLWLDAVHRMQRLARGLENAEPLPNPSRTCKVGAIIFMILVCIMSLGIIAFRVTKEAVIEDLKPDGRFREFYAIPRIRNYVF